MKKTVFSSCIVAALISVAAWADVPNVFSPGQTASSAQVNQNFQSLDQRVNGAVGTLITSGVSSSSDISSGVTSATCAPNTIVLSANCACNNAGGTRNFGVLFGCGVAGNGGTAGCFNEASTFNPNLPPPRADITIVCLGGLQTDGTPLFSAPASKAQPAALDQTENEYRQMELDHANAIKSGL